MTLPSSNVSLLQAKAEINPQYYNPMPGTNNNLTSMDLRYLAGSGWGTTSPPSIKQLPIKMSDLFGKTAYMWVQAQVVYDSASAVLKTTRDTVVWGTSGKQFEPGCYFYGIYNMFGQFNYSGVLINNIYNYRGGLRAYMFDSTWSTYINSISCTFGSISGGMGQYNGPTGVNFFSAADQDQVRNFVILI